MKRLTGISLVASILAVAGVESSTALAGDPTPLIPRAALFGNPDRANVQLSPDGSKISYLAAVDGVLNVWVGPADDPSKAKAVTADKKRGIRQYFWAHTNQHILYLQDQGGDENWRVYSVDLADNSTKDLTPFAGTQAQLQGVNEKFPDEVLIGLNNRKPQLHDMYRVNIRTGEMTVVKLNEGYLAVITDNNFAPRFVMTYTPNATLEVMKISEKGPEPFASFGPEDSLTSSPGGFDKSNGILYMNDSRGRNTAALKAIDLATGKETVIAEDPRADVGGALVHPTEKTIQAVSFEFEREEWKVLDPAIKGDLDYLKTVSAGDFNVASRTLDDTRWIVAYVKDDGPVNYYLYQREGKSAGKAKFLFTNRASLESLKLAKMHPTIIKSRDGKSLISYLTLPSWTDTDGDARPDKPLPIVLFVHGGPWARDSWGYNPYHQWLANRGYAVLSVNFRGSTGLGKDFINAANGQWAATMHDDLIDAVNWSVDQKIAERSKVAIMGGSYGGYATLVGLTFTPDVFACGVDIVGPSNLITLMQNVPPYWMPFYPVLSQRVGDPSTPEGKKLLEERSPLTYVEKITRPLLIGQGANDPRVKQVEADQIAAAMQAKKIPVTYVLYPDEGHGFARPENNMAFNAVTEAFLGRHLGGRIEPFGDSIAKSSAQIKSGAEQIPGLAEAAGVADTKK